MSAIEAEVINNEEAIAIREPQTEIVAVQEPEPLARTLAADPYVGVAAVPFDAKAQEVLMKYQEVPDDWIDIRPEGLIYLSHMKLRRVLNEAFGFGGWAIVPVGDFRSEKSGDKVTLYRTYRLYVNGRYAGEVEASGDYYTTNPAQNYADAAEAAQSYALNRLGKNFGIASQCWDKAYGDKWKAEYAEQYTNNKGKKAWGKKGVIHADAMPVPTIKTATKDSGAEAGTRPTNPPVAAKLSPTSPASAPDVVEIAVSDVGTPKHNSLKKCEQAYVTSLDGKRYSVFGDDIAIAQMACMSGKKLRLTVKVNGAFNNVEKVEVL